MAESIKRLSGPQNISAQMGSPTTLFTVPSKKLYVVREVHAVAATTSGPAGSSTPTVFLGLTDLATGHVVHAQVIESVEGGYAAEADAMALPFTEGESLVAAYSGFPSIDRWDYASGNAATWKIATSTDAASFTAASFTPQAAISEPCNVFFIIVNTKATTPDAVSSITDNHSPSAKGIASISTVATSTIRASIWGGYLPSLDTATATYVIAFGGTQTGCYGDALTFAGSAAYPGTPATSNIVLQTATNSGTTETVQSVTMTPTAGDVGFQLLVVGTVGAIGETYTGGTGSLEIADSALGTPDSGAAIYLFDPPVTNPSATAGVAGTSWAAVCIEVARGGYPITLSTSGIIIE